MSKQFLAMTGGVLAVGIAAVVLLLGLIRWAETIGIFLGLPVMVVVFWYGWSYWSTWWRQLPDEDDEGFPSVRSVAPTWADVRSELEKPVDLWRRKDAEFHERRAARRAEEQTPATPTADGGETSEAR